VNRSRPAIVELTIARTKEFIREPEAIFWVFFFPVLLALVLGFAFSERGQERIPVAIVASETAAAWSQALAESPAIEPLVMSAEEARLALRTGRVSLVVAAGDPVTYQWDPTRPDAQIARLATDQALQREAGQQPVFQAEDLQVADAGSRYIDFLIPGLLGMNLMGTGMWGIGFSVVNARVRKLLKRLVATPMRKSDYLFAQIFSRLFFLVLEVVLVVGFGVLVFGVPLRGSILLLGFLALIGAMTFAGLGLLVASRAKTIEGVSGLMNVVMLPMWLCSGVFFSSERFPDPAQPFIQALPLTALNDSLRAVMLDGAGIVAVMPDLLIMVAWGVVTFTVALTIFRWR
jgi:ABC-2 type transport system permease protein